MEFEERYFREELDYLRQLSKLLATEKPHLARFLAEKDADPDIERLLEGVAFLTGNLRQKIEDEFPELTHGLIKMLWPNYLRPVPAMTLIEYTPDMDKSSVPVLIPRNEQFTTNAGEIRVDEVLPSDAKKEEPPPCTFTLCRDIWLLPVRLCIPTRKITRSAVGCSASLVCQTHCTEEAGMNSNVLTQTIVTGSDPRGLPEFSAIREEINKASHPSQPELNWKLVESLALAIFKANGVDLHTATYYTLARTRTQGLAGFCEGAELLAAMVSHDWDKFWPQGGPARTEMLDWFNSRTGNILRQQISFAESDLPLIYRTERALQLICDKLQQVELKRVPRVENLLYFMQNTRKRLEPQLKSNTENAAQTTVRTLIYAPETQASSTPEAVVPPLPGLPEMKVEVRSLTENPPQASVIKQGSTVRGFIAGIACSVAVASALWWWQVYPVQQQLLQVNDTAQGAATVWMASPELENYERRLQQLLDTSPVQPLETGMQMMRVADSRWPESLQQQQASTQWNEALKTRAQSSPQLRGWLQTRQDLHAFADLVMQREKEGLTLSYIKNVIWQAERGLGQETPVESLLTQYHDARAQKQNTDALEKQINERLEGVLSRWLLLKNNVMPEAATGTTAEK
ncbi:type VI secretion system baseplate subunit TssF [Escherichia coli]|nr:type VI secretion system baseplate subunit TssF [Escherichia coli]ELF8282552.1 type VI secretion system baseplate subunit TssF [Escherichia coli]UUQ31939.1 type VI secretion system baseplate subunit TssF [Escherichia coli]HBJ1308692.1 type VI secretion system baseplate subunit TssF [Escherichia coli]